MAEVAPSEVTTEALEVTTEATDICGVFMVLVAVQALSAKWVASEIWEV